MFKRLLVLMLAVMAFSGAVPAMAQVDPWFVYLYNGTSKELLRVYQDGTQGSFSLGLDENTFISSFDMAFTYTGNQVAFCTVQYAADGSGTATLIVRDIEQQTNVQTLDLGKALGCRTGQHGYGGMMDSILSVSLVRHIPGDPNADTSLPAWQILLVEPYMGMTLFELNANSPEAAAAGITTQQPIIPYVQRIDANSVIFAPVPYGIGGGAEWPAYRWAMGQSVEPVPVWGNISLDTLSLTDEKVWVAADPDRAAVEPFGPIPPYNIVKIADRNDEEQVIYYNGEWVVANAKFINNGRQVAVLLVAGVDPNNPNPTSQISKWMAVDRSGNVTDLFPEHTYAMLETAPDGYVVLNVTEPRDGVNLRTYELLYGTDAGQTSLWSFQTEDFSQTWELAWSAPTADDGSIQPFNIP